MAQTPDSTLDKALIFAQGSLTKNKSSPNDSTYSKESSSKSSKSPKGSKRVTNVCCCNCGALGHTSYVCPKLKPQTPPLAQIHAMADIDDASEASNKSSVIILAQATDTANTAQATYVSPPDRRLIDSDFVLLDSQSTVDLFSNPKHVQNICPASKPIKVYCNKGSMAMTQVADFGDT
jgi:hypothetical protein